MIYKGNSPVSLPSKGAHSIKSVYKQNTLVYRNGVYVNNTPVMTAANRPTPYTIYSPSESSTTYAAWKAVDNNLTTSWITASNTFPAPDYTGNQYWWLDLGSTANAKKFCKLVITCQTTANWPKAAPAYFFIQASNESGSNFKTLYTRNGKPNLTDWDINPVKEFIWDEPEIAYRYWSVTIRKTNGYTQTGVADFKFYTLQ